MLSWRGRKTIRCTTTDGDGGMGGGGRGSGTPFDLTAIIFTGSSLGDFGGFGCFCCLGDSGINLGS